MEKLLDLKYTDVVGVTYNNDDGTSRQEILATAQEMDSVELRYYLYDGAPAYSVHLSDGRCIGHVSSFFARTVRDAYGNCRISAYISKIKGGHDGLNYGCEIGISFYTNESISDTSTSHDTVIAPLDEKVLKRLKVNRVLFLILAIVFAFLGLITLPLGIIFILFAVFFFVAGRKATTTIKSQT